MDIKRTSGAKDKEGNDLPPYLNTVLPIDELHEMHFARQKFMMEHYTKARFDSPTGYTIYEVVIEDAVPTDIELSNATKQGR